MDKILDVEAMNEDRSQEHDRYMQILKIMGWDFGKKFDSLRNAIAWNINEKTGQRVTPIREATLKSMHYNGYIRIAGLGQTRIERSEAIISNVEIKRNKKWFEKWFSK